MTAIASVERLSNLGYGMLGVQASAKQSVTPSVGFRFYKADLNTDMKIDEDNSVAGVRSEAFDSYAGQREHIGTLEVLAEPNTAEFWFDMLMKQGNITGGGDPYTHPFTEDVSNSYTIDILKGQIVERFVGCQIESIEFSADKNKLKFTMQVSAISSFIVRKIKTISTVTLTLDVDYDQAPNNGLVVGDLVRVMKADKSTILDTVIATSGVNADGITIILGASAAAFAAGDEIWIRGQTPAYTTLPPFLWGRTEFRFGTSASVALTAAQNRLESGSKWKIQHKFNKKQGEDRSGGQDPDSLVRLQTSIDLTLKRFFDQPQDSLQKYLSVDPSNALVIRHFSGSNHELRITINKLIYKLDKRNSEAAKILYEELTGRANYNSSDGQAFDVKVINALST